MMFQVSFLGLSLLAILPGYSLKTRSQSFARSGIINGRNSTWGAEWWAHAEDQVLRTTLFHAEAPAMWETRMTRPRDGIGHETV